MKRVILVVAVLLAGCGGHDATMGKGEACVQRVMKAVKGHTSGASSELVSATVALACTKGPASRLVGDAAQDVQAQLAEIEGAMP